MSEADEHALKRQIAGKRKFKYIDVVNGTQPFAFETHGIEAYNLEKIAEWIKSLAEVKKASSAESTESSFDKVANSSARTSW